MERLKHRSDVKVPRRASDNASKTVLNTLETGEIFCRNVVVEAIAVIKFGANKSITESIGRFKRENSANTSKVTQVIESRRYNRRDVSVHRQSGVKSKPEITSRVARRDR